ncbi:MAG: hypothetical protein WCO82_00350 [Sphingomonadales bacterium]|jgi:hypothetical protein
MAEDRKFVMIDFEPARIVLAGYDVKGSKTGSRVTIQIDFTDSSYSLSDLVRQLGEIQARQGKSPPKAGSR